MAQADEFFSHPILNSPYEIPKEHWELDGEGQPTQRKVETRRPAQYVVPIPKAKKQKGSQQGRIVFDEGRGLSREGQEYDPTPIINELRAVVGTWRNLPKSAWGVTPETARLRGHHSIPDW
jgi:type III restriction enzyme